MIEIYLLEALCALYDYGTLSAAAQHLHISPPALSRSMQKLEDLFVVSLFERTKQIVFNETGKMAASMAKRILESEKDMISIPCGTESLYFSLIPPPGCSVQRPGAYLQPDEWENICHGRRYRYLA